MTLAERKEKRKALFAKQGGLCWLCGGLMSLEPPTGRAPHLATFYHLTPKGLGGTHDDSNLKLAHHGCNTARDQNNIVGVPIVRCA